MTIINMHQAKTHLSRLVKQACDGEEVIIAKAGEPLVKIVKYTEEKQSRTPGGWKGKMWIAPDFDDESPEINKMFYGDDYETSA